MPKLHVKDRSGNRWIVKMMPFLLPVGQCRPGPENNVAQRGAEVSKQYLAGGKHGPRKQERGLRAAYAGKDCGNWPSRRGMQAVTLKRTQI